MKQINGKNFYICLGYLNREQMKNQINASDIKPIFMKSKDTTVYVDDSDKNNITVLPLIQVNEIQKKKKEYNFRVLVNPRKIIFENDEYANQVNIIGLFCEYCKGSIKCIKHIAFYPIDHDTIITKNDSSITYSILSTEDKILEAIKDEK